jgi:hypothetical protein
MIAARRGDRVYLVLSLDELRAIIAALAYWLRRPHADGVRGEHDWLQRLLRDV